MFAEGALGFGRISHDSNDDALEQFEYEFREGCEQNGACLRLGAGRGFKSCVGYLYGEIDHLSSGFSRFDTTCPAFHPRYA
ncbi:MAG: hypothetical protein AVO35_05660 [Candidatus Aegiribacteria sp. MLS_C]|nr:MAG: hypothetical protein AVO35_05660 [Candidatus Aegiribacteria sp. MLS_C]